MQRRTTVLIVSGLAAGVAALDAAPPLRPQPDRAAAGPLARLILVVELEVHADGSTRAIGSEILRSSADAVALAKRMAAAEVDQGVGVEPTDTGPAGDKPSFKGQCQSIASSSGKQCRKRATAGSDRCELHERR